MSHLDKIQKKEVTRKEFLTIVGTGLLSIMGFSTIMKLVGYKGFNSSSNNRSNSTYGGGAYGK